MSNPSKDILEQSIAKLGDKRHQLEENRKVIEFEIQEINKTISGLNALISGRGYTPPSFSGAIDQGQDQTPAEKPKGKTPAKKVTPADVRKAVITLSKEPFPPLPGAHKLIDGYFTISQVCDVMGLSSTPNTVRNAIVEFEKKGILEAQPYKNGNQYRYIPPAETGPGVAASRPRENQGSTSPGAEPIPGTGNSKIHAASKDIEKMLRAAQGQGFKVERRGSDHYQVSKNGSSTSISATHTGGTGATKHSLERIGVRL